MTSSLRSLLVVDDHPLALSGTTTFLAHALPEVQVHAAIGRRQALALVEEGVRDETYEAALKRVFAWQLEEARRNAGISKTAMAEAMKSSRTQVDRVLDPENVSVSLQTLARAARAAEARLKGFEGDSCGACGNFTLVRNGTCMKCDTCGSTTGCS